MASAGSQFRTVAAPTMTANSSALAINAGGNIAGSFVSSVDNRTHAFATINGVAVDLGTLATGP